VLLCTLVFLPNAELEHRYLSNHIERPLQKRCSSKGSLRFAGQFSTARALFQVCPEPGREEESSRPPTVLGCREVRERQIAVVKSMHVAPN
jgi:hypothetical protein